MTPPIPPTPPILPRPLKILLLSDTYPPTMGGAELQTQLLGRKLSQRGHQVSVATYWQLNMADHEQDTQTGGNPIDIYRVQGISAKLPGAYSNPARRVPPPLPDPGAVAGLKKLLDKVQPDVVHSYGWLTYSMAVALVGRKTPLVVAMREYCHTCALRTMLHEGKTPCSGPGFGKCLSCAQTFFGAAKGVVAVLGVYSGKALLKKKVRGVHSISTYMHDLTWRDLFDGNKPGQANAVVSDMLVPSFRDDVGEQKHSDPVKLKSYTDQLPIEPFILFVGALRKVKGLEPLMQAYTQLKNAPPLVLIGLPAHDTPTEWPVGVKVLNNFPHDAVMAAWERSLLGVAPSLWPEPFGNVVHEAMSKGKPMIGTTPGGHTDMILEDETGYLIKPGDAEALRDAMQRLIDDPDLRERLGVAARERSKMFTSEYSVPRFEQLYYEVIDRSK